MSLSENNISHNITIFRSKESVKSRAEMPHFQEYLNFQCVIIPPLRGCSAYDVI